MPWLNSDACLTVRVPESFTLQTSLVGREMESRLTVPKQLRLELFATDKLHTVVHIQCADTYNCGFICNSQKLQLLFLQQVKRLVVLFCFVFNGKSLP